MTPVLLPLTPLVRPPPTPMRLLALVFRTGPEMSLKAPLTLLAETMELSSRAGVVTDRPPPEAVWPEVGPLTVLPTIVLS